jgi:hypothetical protein
LPIFKSTSNFEKFLEVNDVGLGFNSHSRHLFIFQDISNELQNKINVYLIEAVHSAELIRKHGFREAMIRSGKRNIQRARQAQEIILKAAIVMNDPDAHMKLAILKNEIVQG